ncbi:MAG: 16S rRNA (uracil(1498)-N(3))-methyltransferase [Burkholderiales bacterium]
MIVMPRFYISEPPLTDMLYPLPAQAAHHAMRVLRMARGDDLVLFDGSGREWRATVARIDKREVVVSVTACCAVSRESPLSIVLVQGISSGERMDYTLQKAVELGVTRIQPVACGRSVVKLVGERAEKRREHWQNLVAAACEQCGRNIVPEVAPVMGLKSWLSLPSGPRSGIIFAPAATETLHTLTKPQTEIAILAGPEGGFTDDEYRQAADAGFVAVRLGPRILRTETAALAALGAMQVLWGDI